MEDFLATMLIDIGDCLDLCPKAPVEAERIQIPHFVIILLPSDWESQLQKITNESVHTNTKPNPYSKL